MGRRGAVGSLRAWGSPRKEASASTTFSGEHLSLRRVNTAIVWPSDTFTRGTEAEIANGACSKPPLVNRPRIRRGSVSIFSTSPPPM